jgi:predicted DNA-binding transcriptional regulator AlpA
MVENQRTVSPMQMTSVATNLDAALNENQAANFLGVSVRTLQAWRVRGGGPRYMKIGRAVRYQHRELVAFQETHTVSSTTEAGALQRA